MRDPNVLTLGERLEVEAAVEAAFAPLRERHTDLSPLRVRAAVRWGRGVPRASPQALRWGRAIARLSELSVAVGMSIVIFGAALGPVFPEAAPPDAPLPARPARVAGPSMDEQREAQATRQEWLESLRARLEVLRRASFQDWLDPTVTRPAVRGFDVPAPRTDVVGQSGLY